MTGEVTAYIKPSGAARAVRHALAAAVAVLLVTAAQPLALRAQEAGDPPTVQAMPTTGTPTTETPTAETATDKAESAVNDFLEGTARAAVSVNGRKILEITGDTTAAALERAEKVNLRLERLIERVEAVEPFAADDIVMSNGQPLITLGGEPILTVTPADAGDNLMSPQDLSLLWGGKLGVAVAEARTARSNPLRGVGILVRHSIRDLVVSTVQWLPRLAGALLVWLVFWCLARFCRWLVTSATSRIQFDPNLRQLARTITFYGVWAAGFVAILSTLGIDSTSIATAVGVSGFVLGFAFKDTLSHFFAGLMLLLGRQFHIGGQIVVGEFEGTVERIELRALHLRTYDNRLVTIPNGDVFTSAVISNTTYAYRRREFSVGIGYQEDIDKAQRVALQTLLETQGVLTEPAPLVLADELAASTVNLRVLYYADPLYPEWLQLGSECVCRVKEAFAREGITMPADIRYVHLRNAGEVAGAVAGAFSETRNAPSHDSGASRNGQAVQK